LHGTGCRCKKPLSSFRPGPAQTARQLPAAEDGLFSIYLVSRMPLTSLRQHRMSPGYTSSQRTNRSERSSRQESGRKNYIKSSKVERSPPIHQPIFPDPPLGLVHSMRGRQETNGVGGLNRDFNRVDRDRWARNGIELSGGGGLRGDLVCSPCVAGTRNVGELIQGRSP
jgi:hypothetical protein